MKSIKRGGDTRLFLLEEFYDFCFAVEGQVSEYSSLMVSKDTYFKNRSVTVFIGIAPFMQKSRRRLRRLSFAVNFT